MFISQNLMPNIYNFVHRKVANSKKIQLTMENNTTEKETNINYFI